MIYSIGIEELVEGQVYSEPLYMEEGVMFTPSNIPVRSKDIAKLKTLGIESVFTKGQLTVKPPPPPPPPPAASQQIKKPTGLENDVYTNLFALIVKLNAVFENITPETGRKEKLSLSVRHLWALTSRLLSIIKESRADALSFILCGVVKDLELAKSSVNTAILSALIAEEFKFTNDKILEITAGALLHDVGMLRLPKEIIEKKEALTDEEVRTIMSHTSISFHIIHKELIYPITVGVMALQHHERWDGTGYPHRLVGNAIDQGASIICIADAFEAMVRDRPYRNAVIGYKAMKNIVSENASHFSPEAIKAFVKVIGMYPIGSGVVLNDGRIARVIDFKSDAPLRPIVKVIALNNVKKIENGEIIDLLSNKTIFITQAIDIRGI